MIQVREMEEQAAWAHERFLAGLRWAGAIVDKIEALAQTADLPSHDEGG